MVSHQCDCGVVGRQSLPGSIGARASTDSVPGPIFGGFDASNSLIVSFAWNANVVVIDFVVLSAALYMVPAILRRAGMSMKELCPRIMSPTSFMVSIAFAVSLAIYFLGMLVAQAIFVHRELG